MAKRLLRPKFFVVRCGSDVPPVIMRGYSIEQCVRSLGAVTRMLGTREKRMNLSGWSWAHLPRIQTWHAFRSMGGKGLRAGVSYDA